MTTKELEALLGGKIAAKVEFVCVGERLFHRQGRDEWCEYEAIEVEGAWMEVVIR